MGDAYNKDYRTREYDRFSDLEPERERKKPSFLTMLLVGLLVFLVCSLGYDNIIKPYLEKSKEQIEKPVAISSQEAEQPPSSEVVEATSMDEDVAVPEVRKEPVQKSQPVSPEQVSVAASPTPIPEATPTPKPEVKPTAKPAESVASVPSSRQRRESEASTSSSTDDYSGLSTLEIMERRNHADVVRQAKRAGVSTEGTTLEIMERINHADVVRQAKRAGVSTEGTTLEIMERINHADVVRQAKRAGVSTEGTTLEIMERINHADVVRQAKRAGVSTEGTTLEIMERINRKEMQRMGY